MKQLVAECIARKLGIESSTLDPNARLADYGFDSVVAAGIIAELQPLLGRRLPTSLFADHQTLHEVWTYLEGGAASAPSAAASSDDDRAPLPDEPIAVVGIGCRTAGARSPDELWRRLVGRDDLLSDVPASRWPVDRHYSPDRNAPGKTNTRRGAFVDEADRFDAPFFAISPREAEQIDPQQRLMLEVAWESLEDAGIAPLSLRGQPVGVYVGVIWSDYMLLQAEAGLPRLTSHSAQGVHHSIVANRISYCLGLEGPSLSVDGACASSAAAVHLACQSLRSGESTMALAGGVNLILAPYSHVAMSKFGALSSDGLCKVFDASADGYVRGEGAIVVALKRLRDAIRDGDQIYCLVLDGYTNSDGRSNGLSAPNPHAQAEMLRRAYRRARRSPERLQYVEAHGTGTALGDPTETTALGMALGKDRSAERPIYIGSIKSNIGHLEAAAGVAALTKVALAMKHRMLPASLHCETPNPEIRFEELGLKVVDRLLPWPKPEEPLLAGVSAFGFGGSNCHLVVEETGFGRAMILAASAPTRELLAARVRAVAEGAAAEHLEWVGRPSDAALAHLGDERHRIAVVAHSRREIVQRLESYLRGEAPPHVAAGEADAPLAGVVMVFGAIGSHWPGMARELLATEPAFRAAVVRCDAVVRELLGWSLLSAMAAPDWGPGGDRTEVVQPVICALEIGLVELLGSWGVAPTAVIGHSVGEAAAAFAAGVLSLEDAMRVICLWGGLVAQDEDDHGLAVVELSRAHLGPRLGGELWIAGAIGPSTTLVAGRHAALSELERRSEVDGVFCRRIAIRYAAHSPLVERASRRLAQALDGLAPRRARVPFYSTVRARAVPGEALDARYWAENLVAPAEFHAAVAAAIADGHELFLEVAGHPTLQRGVRATAAELGRPALALSTLRRHDDGRAPLLRSCAALYARGASIRWAQVYGREIGAAPPPRASVFVLSGRTEKAARDLAADTARWLSTSRDTLEDLCHFAACRRQHHEVRAAVECASREELALGLQAYADARPHDRVVTSARRRGPRGGLAFIFSGQGGQWWGMARELLATQPEFAAVIEACDRLLAPKTGWSLLEELTRSEADSRMDRADVAQPAIFAVQVGLYRLLERWGLRPQAVVGHSVGEVAAAHVSGALSLADAVDVIYHRSRLMARVAGRGRTATVELPVSEVRDAIAGYGASLGVAGSNAPSSTVISGEQEALRSALARFEERGVFCRELRLDIAMHSAQLDHLLDDLRGSLSGLRPGHASARVVSTVTGGFHEGAAFDADYWARNMREPFQFTDAMTTLLREGFDTFVEVSPHAILSGAAGQTAAHLGKAVTVVCPLRRGEPARPSCLKALSQLHVEGVSIDWERALGHGGRHVELPHYAWQRERYWVAPPDEETRGGATASFELTPRVRVEAAARPSEVYAWDTLVSVASEPYLRDHAVEGSIVLPGVAQVELALRAALAAASGRPGDAAQVSLEQVAFQRAIVLSEQPTRLQIVLEGEGQELGYCVVDRAPAGAEAGSAPAKPGAVYSSGRVRRGATAARPPAVDLGLLKARLAPVDAEQHYARLGRHGIELGPAFRRASALWGGEREALGRIEVPASLDGGTHVVHPSVLDATLQPIFAALPLELVTTAGDPLIPMAIERFLWWGPVSSVLWSHVRLRPSGSAVTQRCDLTVYDEQGAVVGMLVGLTLRRLGAVAAEREARQAWQYELAWGALPVGDSSAAPDRGAETTFVLVGGDEAARGGLAAALSARGCRVELGPSGEASPERSRSLASALEGSLRSAQEDRREARVVWLGTLHEDAASARALEAAHSRLVELSGLLRWLAAHPSQPRLWLVTRGALPVDAPREVHPVAPVESAVWGFARAAQREFPGRLGGIVDCDASARWEPVASMLLRPGEATQAAVRGDRSYAPHLVQAPVSEASLRPLALRGDRTYLITGGLGGVGLELARHFVARGARRLVLVGRTAVPPRSAWDGVPADSPLGQRLQVLRELEQQGASVLALSADVADRASMAAALERALSVFPALAGVVHAAAVIEPRLLSEVTPEDYALALRAKVGGALVLDELLGDAPLDFFSLFSSMVSVFGVRGQAAYAASNTFLEGLAHERRWRGRPAQVINWGLWGDVGRGANASDARILALDGFLPMDPAAALAAFDVALQSPSPQRLVAEVDWTVVEDNPDSPAGLKAMVAGLAASQRTHAGSQVATRSAEDAASALDPDESLSPTEARERLRRLLTELGAATLHVRPDQLDSADPLVQRGLDSLMAAELRVRIHARRKVHVGMLTLMRGASVDDLVDELSGKLTQAAAAPPPAAPPAPARDEPTTTQPAPQDRDDLRPYPMNEVQYAYLVGRHGVVEWGNVATHYFLEFDGDLDPARLDAAWGAMVARHEILRSEILPSGHLCLLKQVPPYHVRYVDLTDLPRAERDHQLESARERMANFGPGTTAWPYFEVELYRLGPGSTRLLMNLDMMLVDLSSAGLLFRELGMAYSGRRDELPPIDLSLRDYALAQQQALAGEAAASSRAYWEERAPELPPPPQLPRASKADPALLKMPRYSHARGELSKEAWARLKARAAAHNLSPSAVLCAAYVEVLSHYSKSAAFTLNVTQRRRLPLHPHVERLVGDFTSTLLLGVDWTRGDSFVERARRLTEQMWKDLDHSLTSGVEVLAWLSRKRRQRVLMPFVFTSGLEDLAADMGWAGELATMSGSTAQVLLDCHVHEYRGALLYYWDFIDPWFPPGLIATMFEDLGALLADLSADDERGWRDEARRRRVAASWERFAELNETEAPLPAGLLHEPALDRAYEDPDRPAVITSDRTLTYGELVRRAMALVPRLQAAGASPDRLVAVSTQPGWERVVAVFAALLAGAAYVPVDPTLPVARVAHLIRDARACCVLTEAWLDDAIEWPDGVPRLRITDAAPLDALPPRPRPLQQAGDLAYVIYTSGSTGQPKGVMIDHRGAANTCVDVSRRFGVGPGDRVLAVSNLSFDLSVYDLFGVLGAGGAVVYPVFTQQPNPQAWAEAVERHRVTLWNSVPPLMAMLVEWAEARAPRSLQSLRRVLLSGDWIPLWLPDRVRALAPEAELVGLGGATEASIWSNYFPIGAVSPAWPSVPYGFPLANQRFYVLDDQLAPCPPWVTGDLYIGGVGLALGYLGDEERTRASFIVHPQTGERLYRTGDLGCLHPDGHLEFQGREDKQVKIRGFRVELGEIEANLRALDGVREAYVRVRSKSRESHASGPEGHADAVLFAYVVPEADAKPGEKALRTALRQRLPEHMIPSQIVLVDEVPLSQNGKVDWGALAEPKALDRGQDASFVPPRNDVEARLARMWSELLDADPRSIGVRDNFFELGGNSLLLVRMAKLLEEAFQKTVSVISLFEHTTIEAIVSLLQLGSRAQSVVEQARRRAALRRGLLPTGGDADE